MNNKYSFIQKNSEPVKNKPFKKLVNKIVGKKSEPTKKVFDKKKTIKLIKWILYKAAWVTVLYFALFQSHKGAWNIVAFLIWIGFALSFLLVVCCVINDDVKKSISKSAPMYKLQQKLMVAFTIGEIILLVYTGHFVYALVESISSFFLLISFGSVKEYEKKIEKEKNANNS